MADTLLQTLYPLLDIASPGASGSVAPTIQIDRSKLQEFWLKGIVNDLTYVAFALELHDKPTLDLQQFSRDWSVDELSDSQKDEGLKPKTLKVRSILNAICILDRKGMADCNFSVQVSQLSLFD